MIRFTTHFVAIASCAFAAGTHAVEVKLLTAGAYKSVVTELHKEFGKGDSPRDKFLPIAYREQWEIVRKIDQALGESYKCK